MVKMFKEVDEKDIAELFGISIEQAKKAMDDGTIQCLAKDTKESLNEKY